MAYKEKEIEKLYYSIGEVAEMFNVAPSLIRFWETEFEIIQPKKNRKGNRQFTREDIDNVKLIFHLVKEKGFTLQGAKEMVKSDSVALRDKMEVIDSLRNIRKFLQELRENLWFHTYFFLMTQERLALLALRAVPGIGDHLFKQLIGFFGSAQSVFELPKRKLHRIYGIGETISSAITNKSSFKSAEQEIKKAESRRSASLVSSGAQ